jgi:hypothetical protein
MSRRTLAIKSASVIGSMTGLPSRRREMNIGLSGACDGLLTSSCFSQRVALSDSLQCIREASGVQQDESARVAHDNLTSTYWRNEATCEMAGAAVQVLVPASICGSTCRSRARGNACKACQKVPQSTKPNSHHRCRQGRRRDCVKMGLACDGLLDQVVREVMLRCVNHGVAYIFV